MHVQLIASTSFYSFTAEVVTPYQSHQSLLAQDLLFQDPEQYEDMMATMPGSADELAEFAGRACYESWSRPNPVTATNEGYLKHILSQSHESVLEHASATFYVAGVSRALLAELTRHRHLSFSVLSQRYVRLDRERVTVPPAIAEYGDETAYSLTHGDVTIHDIFSEALDDAFEAYHVIADNLIEKGVPRKKAYEAARAVLPNATESPMVVTGNIRAWRDVLKKRYHVAADAEIRLFATEVLRQLRLIAPNSVQDFPDEPFGTWPDGIKPPPSAGGAALQAAPAADIPFGQAA